MEVNANYGQSLLNLFKNKGFFVLMLSYGESVQPCGEVTGLSYSETISGLCLEVNTTVKLQDDS